MKISKVKKLKPVGRVAYWVTERERIRLAKGAKEPKPWTDDEILSGYRFCNVRRMDDKVSDWLLRNWYRPYRNHPLMLPAVALARFINLPESQSRVTDTIFKADYWRASAIAAILRDYRDAGNTLFNAAYMVRGNDGVDKVSSVLDHYIESLREGDEELGEDGWLKIDRLSMKSTHAAITKRYGWGDFMAGQVVADLRWAVEGKWVDKDAWAPMGPGSQRGLNRYFGRDLKKSWKASEFLPALLTMRAEVTEVIDDPVVTDRLEAHDWQNVMCEFFKYEKALWGLGTGKPKQKYPGGLK